VPIVEAPGAVIAPCSAAGSGKRHCIQNYIL
jgi:hypothetical protein